MSSIAGRPVTKNASPTVAAEPVMTRTSQPKPALKTNQDEFPTKFARKNVRNGR